MKRSDIRLLARIVAVVLTALMLPFSALAEPALNTEGLPIYDSPVVVTAALDKDTCTASNAKDLVQFQEYVTRLGLDFDVTMYNSEDWLNKITLMVASDKLPDILLSKSFTLTEIGEYGADGYFVNLRDYMDLMPNLAAYFEKNPFYEAYNTAEDGAIYGLAHCEQADYINRAPRVYINQEWLDRLELKAPTSLDELYDVLVAFRDNDANGNGIADDEIPWCYGYCMQFNDRAMLAAQGIYSSEENVLLQADADGNVYLANTTEAYRDFLKFMNKCYREGLIEKDCFSVTSEECQARGKDDLFGFGGMWAGFLISGGGAGEAGDVKWSSNAAFTSANNKTPSIGLNPIVTNDKVNVAINANSEHIEALCRFVDYLFTEEGALSTYSGYEGLTFDWEYIEELGCYSYKTYVPEGFNSESDYESNGITPNRMTNIIYYSEAADATHVSNYQAILDMFKTAEDREAALDSIISTSYAQWAWALNLGYELTGDGIALIDNYPKYSYTQSEADARNAIYTDFDSFLKSAKASFITGEWDIDAYWDTYLSTLENMGLAKLIEVEQQAYSRYCASLN